MNNTNITLAGNTGFKHNGGAIIASDSNLTFTGNTSFLDNSETFGQWSGGAIYASHNTVLNFSGINNFINNLASDAGGAICLSENTVLSLSGINNFNNSAGKLGGAIYTSPNTVLSFDGTTHFINNSAPMGGAIFANGNNTLTINGTIYFTNNRYYVEVDIEFGPNFGGGVYMGPKSTFSILPNTTVYWVKNHATLGGAIYVEDTSPVSYCAPFAALVPKQECFFQLPGQNLSNGIDVQLVFKNNSADVAGSVLYGGAIDNCKLTHGLDSYNSGQVFDMIVHIDNDTDYKTTSIISSDQLQICLCEHNHPDCFYEYDFPRTMYPGEMFQVSVVAVGQRDGTVPSRVVSIINQDLPPGHLPDSQHLQQVNNMCTKLNYTVFSRSGYVVIELYAEGSPCSKLGDKIALSLDITVYINQTCPPGFNISKSKTSCVCESRLAQYTNNCTIKNGVGQIARESDQQFWIGYDDQSQSDDKLILHPLCPYSYCGRYEITFPLNESDKQCAHNRSGLLCGACKEGYSLVLGTSQCRKCTNNYLTLLIPFALMGVALVFLLLVCKIPTVATGTLSGL